MTSKNRFAHLLHLKFFTDQYSELVDHWEHVMRLVRMDLKATIQLDRNKISTGKLGDVYDDVYAVIDFLFNQVHDQPKFITQILGENKGDNSTIWCYVSKAYKTLSGVNSDSLSDAELLRRPECMLTLDDPLDKVTAEPLEAIRNVLRVALSIFRMNREVLYEGNENTIDQEIKYIFECLAQMSVADRLNILSEIEAIDIGEAMYSSKGSEYGASLRREAHVKDLIRNATEQLLKDESWIKSMIYECDGKRAQELLEKLTRK